MALVTVRLFGRVEADVEGIPVRLPGRQTQALFALLCLDRRPRAREAIAADLWPDASNASSASLRQALWLIRSGLLSAGVDADEVIDVDLDTIAIRPAAIDVDVDAFARRVRSHPPDADAAVAIYRGDLAECLGHDVFAADRERLADAYEDMLALDARRRLADGDHESARDAAVRLLARDPLREEAHEVLIAVFGATGTRSQVVRQHRHLVEILRRELDVEPLAETEAVYREALAEAAARSLAAVPPPPAVLPERTELPEPTELPRPVLVPAG